MHIEICCKNSKLEVLMLLPVAKIKKKCYKNHKIWLKNSIYFE